MIYDVYFQICGKKLKASIEANSKEQAMRLLRGKLKIDKVKERDPSVEYLKNMFGIK